MQCFALISLFQYILFYHDFQSFTLTFWRFRNLFNIRNYLIITIPFYVNNKNLPGQFHLTTTSGFWTMSFLTLLKLCLKFYFKNIMLKGSFYVLPDVEPFFLKKPCIHTGDQYFNNKLFEFKTSQTVWWVWKIGYLSTVRNKH